MSLPANISTFRHPFCFRWWNFRPSPWRQRWPDPPCARYLVEVVPPVIKRGNGQIPGKMEGFHGKITCKWICMICPPFRSMIFPCRNLHFVGFSIATFDYQRASCWNFWLETRGNTLISVSKSDIFDIYIYIHIHEAWYVHMQGKHICIRTHGIHTHVNDTHHRLSFERALKPLLCLNIG